MHAHTSLHHHARRPRRPGQGTLGGGAGARVPRREGVLLVSICVATYKRPEGLERLLGGLGRLRFTRLEPPRLEVVVVDNEARGRAALVCRRFAPAFPWGLRCEEEPRQGITYARNRGLERALPAADFVAFIDDDEVPDPSWLEFLLLAQKAHDADVVSGPVRSTFVTPEIPAWVRRGSFFRPRAHADGARIEVAFTHNVLVRASVFRDVGVFDHRFALTGGEDTDFFMRAHKAGHRMVWAQGAVVEEAVPPSRATVGWILRRGYREWGSHSLCEKALYPSLRVRAERVAKATTLVALGCVSLPVTVFLGKHHMVRSLLLVARGAGSFAGLLGRRYYEYQDTAAGPSTPNAAS